MRPVRLEIEGFTCFRERQVVDFEKLGLFAISGPTGAGKSSILDAMVFALFGCVPRIGKRGIAELIALGQDRMSVVFEFAVGAARYRVARVAHRTQATKVQLDRAAEPDWYPVAGSVRTVAEEVERILGLNQDTFQQAILLPQGQFSKFLKADPKDQRLVLRNLLRVEVYEALRKGASARAHRAETEADGLRKRLEEDYANVSPGVVDALANRRERLDTDVRARTVALETSRECLRELERRLRAWKAVHVHVITLTDLDVMQPIVEADTQRLEAARRAGPVVPWVAAAVRAREAVARAEDALAGKDRATAEVRTAVDTAASVLVTAEAEALALPELEARIGKLEGVVALLPALAACRRRVTDEAQVLGAAVTAAAAHGAAIGTARASLADVDDTLRDLDEKLATLGYDPERHARLQEVQGAVGQTVVCRRAWDESEVELGRSEDEALRASRHLGEEAHRLSEAEQRLRDHDLRYEHLRIACAEVELQHGAHVLREHLAVGSACPVCEQSVATLPTGAPPADLHAHRTSVSEALSERKDAEAVRDGLARCRLEAEAARSGALAAREQAGTRRDRRLGELRALEAELTQKSGLSEDAEPIEVRLSTVLAAANQVAEQFAAGTAARTRVRETQTKLEAASTLAGSKQAAAIEEAERTRVRLVQAEEELRSVELRLGVLVDIVDPDREQTRSRQRVLILRMALDESRTTLERCRRDAATADAEQQAADEALTEARARAEDDAARSRRAAQDAGFPDLPSVLAAVLDADAQAAIERRVSQWRSDREQTQRRLTEAREEAGSTSVDEPRVVAEREALAAAGRELSEQQQTLGALTRALADANIRLETAIRLEGEQKRAQADSASFGRIATDLRSDGFEKWLLDGTFRALVQAASVRLLETSGRYTLDYRDDEFWVVDHDNAREQRKADTLSGGETFLASLCLALALSEQVQRASGAVRLDSLFIDEGFGTLDPETLDTVAGAIELLGEGDRMVGIITHVAELTARLPARIVVQKGATGSFVRVSE